MISIWDKINRGESLSILVICLIVLGVIILFIATRFLSKAFKIITKIMLFLIMVLVIMTVLVYNDMNGLKTGFAEKNNTFFLYKNKTLYSAITLKPLAKSDLGIDSFNYFTLAEIEKAEQELNQENYESLLKNNYRILIIKPGLINRSYNLKLGRDFNQDDLLEVILSKDPFMVVAEKTQETYGLELEELKDGLKQVYESKEKLKGYLFAGLLANYFQTQKPGELIVNIKNRNLRVRPETISFKVIRYLPWV